MYVRSVSSVGRSGWKSVSLISGLAAAIDFSCDHSLLRPLARSSSVCFLFLFFSSSCGVSACSDCSGGISLFAYRIFWSKLECVSFFLALFSSVARNKRKNLWNTHLGGKKSNEIWVFEKKDGVRYFSQDLNLHMINLRSDSLKFFLAKESD